MKVSRETSLLMSTSVCGIIWKKILDKELERLLFFIRNQTSTGVLSVFKGFSRFWRADLDICVFYYFMDYSRCQDRYTLISLCLNSNFKVLRIRDHDLDMYKVVVIFFRVKILSCEDIAFVKSSTWELLLSPGLYIGIDETLSTSCDSEAFSFL